jgi:WhiB family transcriptional regulator, redox-sensing transcriptional regulator
MPPLSADKESWRKQALCAGHPGRKAWFADDPFSLRQAKAFCRACPVASECLAFAMATDEQDGVWGGMTVVERARLRRELAHAG